MESKTKLVVSPSNNPTNNKQSIFRNVRFDHMAAGITGGAVSSLALHPLDLIKVRFQVDEGPGHAAVKRPQYRGVIDAFRTIIETEGYKGLYRGVTPNVLGASLSWGLYFFFYNSTKTWMQQGDGNKYLGPGHNTWMACFAGCATVTVSNPIWVAKTRMCLHYGTPGKVQFLSLRETLSSVYRMEGIGGLYRGYLPGLFGVSHGVIQFVVYEEMQVAYNKHKGQPPNTRLSSVEYLTFAALSKIVAAATTYPYQVVRSRLQDQHRTYNGTWDVVKQIWKQESFRGLYKGMIPYMVHIMPSILIVFGVYESILNRRSDPELNALDD